MHSWKKFFYIDFREAIAYAIYKFEKHMPNVFLSGVVHSLKQKPQIT